MTPAKLAIAAVAILAIMLTGLLLASDLSGVRQVLVRFQGDSPASAAQTATAVGASPAPTVAKEPSGTQRPLNSETPVPGPTAVPALAATYSAEPPAVWGASQTQGYEITLRNSGSATWSPDGSEPVHLGVHFGLESDTPHEGWSSDQRFSLPRSVAPGESVTLKLDITAPSAPGNYLLRHRMVKEGVLWFSQTLKKEAMVAGTDRVARVISIEPSVEPDWQGGQMRTISAVSIKNEGTEGWNARGDGRVRLSVHFGKESDFPHNGWTTDQRFDLPEDVPAGGTAVFRNLSVTAPLIPGDYVLRLRMVKEGVSWFYQIRRVSVTVTGTLRKASYSSPTLSAEPWVVLETRNVSITVTNEGTESWTAAGDHPVRLGIHFGQETDAPHEGWASDQRFALPAGDVPPGQSVTLTNVRVTGTPRPGSYLLRFRMVKEGAAWFDQVQKLSVQVRP